MPLNRKIAFYLFYVGLFGLAASIPVSKFATSVGMLLMSAAWFVHWNWKEKLTLLKKNYKPLIASAGLFLIFVVGLIHSENTAYALKDLKIKAPLFILPVVFSLSFPIKRIHILYALTLMGASAIVASVIGFVSYSFRIDKVDELVNLRAISPFISLIRLSLILSMAFGLGLWGLVQIKSILRFLLIFPLTWIVFILGFSESLTGLVFLPVISLFFIGYLLNNHKKSALTFLVFVVITSVFVISEVKEIYDLVFETKEQPVLEKTVNNNRYLHDLEHTSQENGYFVYRNICLPEIKREWDKRSSVPFGSKINGHAFRANIFRYLTSKGLNKDSLGLSHISDSEIKAIEKGIPNYYYLESNPIEIRVHKLFWELFEAIKSGRYKGNSVTLRYVFAKTGISIIDEHLFFGVGTGDVKDAFLKKYEKRPNHREEQFDKKAHNQYITTAVALGLVGCVLFIGALIFVFNRYKWGLRYLFYLTYGILFVGMLWEDTLETQAGVAIFSLWLNLFLFQRDGENLVKKPSANPKA